VLDGGQATYNASSGVKQQFTGHQRDEETDLDYFGERCFCPQTGQFTSPDPGNAGATPPNPQTWNAYGYAYNNPYKYADPSGACPILVLDYYDSEGADAGSDIWYCMQYFAYPGGPWFSPPQGGGGGAGGGNSGNGFSDLADAMTSFKNRTQFSQDCHSGLAAIANATGKDITPASLQASAGNVTFQNGVTATNTTILGAFGPGYQTVAGTYERLNGGSGATVADFFTNNAGVLAWTPQGGDRIWINPRILVQEHRSPTSLQGFIMHELIHNLGPHDQQILDALAWWTRTYHPEIEVNMDWSQSRTIGEWMQMFCVEETGNY
jgi:RHS repeat-associated protein